MVRVGLEPAPRHNRTGRPFTSDDTRFNPERLRYPADGFAMVQPRQPDAHFDPEPATLLNDFDAPPGSASMPSLSRS